MHLGYRPRLHKGQSPEDYFTETLTAYWQEFYPHYAQIMRERVADLTIYKGLDGQPVNAIEDHKYRVRGNWYGPFLAMQATKAEFSWWPAFLSKWWMISQLFHAQRPIETLARERHTPAWVLRAFAVKHGFLRGEGFWYTLRWIFKGGERQAEKAPRIPHDLVEQQSFEDWIFVRREGSEIMLPIEAVMRGEL